MSHVDNVHRHRITVEVEDKSSGGCLWVLLLILYIVEWNGYGLISKFTSPDTQHLETVEEQP